MNKHVLNGVLKLSNSILKLAFIFLVSSFLSQDIIAHYSIISSVIIVFTILAGADVYYYYHRRYVQIDNEVKFSNQLFSYLINYIAILPLLVAFFFNRHDIFIITLIYFLVIFEHLSDEFSRLIILCDSQLSASFLILVKGSLWCLFLLPILYCVPSLRSLEAILCLWLLFSTIACLYGVVKLKKLGRSFFEFSKIDVEVIKSSFKVGGVYIITSISSKLLFSFDKVYLEYYSGLEVVASYFLFFGIGMGSLGLLEPVVISFMYPKLLAVRNIKEHNEIVNRMVLYSLVFIVFGFVFLSIATRPFLVVFDMQGYLNNFEIFFPILVMVSIIVLSRIPVLLLFSIGQDLKNGTLGLFVLILCTSLVFVRFIDSPELNLIFSIASSFFVVGLIRIYLYFRYRNGVSFE